MKYTILVPTKYRVCLEANRCKNFPTLPSIPRKELSCFDSSVDLRAPRAGMFWAVQTSAI